MDDLPAVLLYCHHKTDIVAEEFDEFLETRSPTCRRKCIQHDVVLVGFDGRLWVERLVSPCHDLHVTWLPVHGRSVQDGVPVYQSSVLPRGVTPAFGWPFGCSSNDVPGSTWGALAVLFRPCIRVLVVATKNEQRFVKIRVVRRWSAFFHRVDA